MCKRIRSTCSGLWRPSCSANARTSEMTRAIHSSRTSAPRPVTSSGSHNHPKRTNNRRSSEVFTELDTPAGEATGIPTEVDIRWSSEVFPTPDTPVRKPVLDFPRSSEVFPCADTPAGADTCALTSPSQMLLPLTEVTSLTSVASGDIPSRSVASLTSVASGDVWSHLATDVASVTSAEVSARFLARLRATARRLRRALNASRVSPGSCTTSAAGVTSGALPGGRPRRRAWAGAGAGACKPIARSWSNQ